jgi:hypothetical protein
MYCSSILFKSFKIGSGQVSERLISGHLGFRVVRVRVGSDFESSNFGFVSSFRLFGFGSGRILDSLILDHLRF